MSDAPTTEGVDPLSLFSPQIQQAVEGLAYLGQLTDTIRFCGHTFGLRTLRPQHKFAIGQVLQPYRNTIMEVDIYRDLHVATALTHVDGNTHFCDPIGPDPTLEDFVRARLSYVANDETGWYPPTLEYLWDQYMILEATATKAIIELHSLSLRGQPQSLSPWLDSLTEPASSPEETTSDIPLFTAFKSS